jgi:hypothetical protein
VKGGQPRIEWFALDPFFPTDLRKRHAQVNQPYSLNSLIAKLDAHSVCCHLLPR